MVSQLAAIFLLAHGADPTPLDWDEALANLVKFTVTIAMIGFMAYPILAPLLTGPPAKAEATDGVRETPGGLKNEIVGWIALGLVIVLGLGWWLLRTSVVEVMTEETRMSEEHAHTQTEGGQVAMWADFHAEVVRVESGEIRIYLRDSYNRDIDARYFEAEIVPLEKDTLQDSEAEQAFVVASASLNDAYRFARLPREFTTYRLRISTPGWSTTLKFDFDGTQGRRSLPIWCATPDSDL